MSEETNKPKTTTLMFWTAFNLCVSAGAWFAVRGHKPTLVMLTALTIFGALASPLVIAAPHLTKKRITRPWWYVAASRIQAVALILCFAYTGSIIFVLLSMWNQLACETSWATVPNEDSKQ